MSFLSVILSAILLSQWFSGANAADVCDVSVDVPKTAPFGEKFKVTLTYANPNKSISSFVSAPIVSIAANTKVLTLEIKCDEDIKKVPIIVDMGPAETIDSNEGWKNCLNEVREVQCVKESSGKNDPHFTTFSGERYDYHGECDLVMLKNPSYNNGTGLDVHIRTKIEIFYSYIRTAIVRIGQETFEVTGAPGNQYWLNSRPGVEFPARISGHAIGYRRIDENQHRYNIILGQGNGEHIEISTYKHFVGVSVKQGTYESFSGSLGLLGSFKTGKKVARDGVTIIADANEFGQEWQVLPSDPQLFRNIEGPQYPEMCLLPTITFMKGRNLRADVISPEEAHAACSRVNPVDYDICVFDVIATNDVGIAGAY